MAKKAKHKLGCIRKSTAEESNSSSLLGRATLPGVLHSVQPKTGQERSCHTRGIQQRTTELFRGLKHTPGEALRTGFVPSGKRKTGGRGMEDLLTVFNYIQGEQTGPDSSQRCTVVGQVAEVQIETKEILIRHKEKK